MSICAVGSLAGYRTDTLHKCYDGAPLGFWARSVDGGAARIVTIRINKVGRMNWGVGCTRTSVKSHRALAPLTDAPEGFRYHPRLSQASASVFVPPEQLRYLICLCDELV
jgi:hypothetical protein